MSYPTTPGYVNGSDTSEAAADSINAATLRAQARRLLEGAPDGLTSDELEAITGWPHQTASARLRELVLYGDAYDSPTRRLTRHGRYATVRRTLGAGRQESGARWEQLTLDT